MDKRFIGTGVAIITPFKNNEIDFDGLTNVIEHVISGGVDYIVGLGSTGETATLDKKESKKVLDHVIKINAGRLPLVAGNFAGNNTKELCENIAEYDFTGIDAILSSSPAYVKPNQEGIYLHYMEMAKVSPIPIILYNVPGRTRSNMEWETTIRLSNASPKFVGIKEASGDLIQATRIIINRPPNFFVVSGDDEVALAMVSIGGDGVISVMANVFPKEFSSMIKAGRNDDFKTARKLNFLTYDLHKWLYIEGNPVGIKSAAKIIGLCGNDVRLPLAKMSRSNYECLKEEVKKIVSIIG